MEKTKPKTKKKKGRVIIFARLAGSLYAFRRKIVRTPKRSRRVMT